jgi:DNA primase catalytic subunit
MEFKPNGMENPKYVGIDAPVTIDTARLIRLPGSIHGKTMQECRIIKVD